MERPKKKKKKVKNEAIDQLNKQMIGIFFLDADRQSLTWLQIIKWVKFLRFRGGFFHLWNKGGKTP